MTSKRLEDTREKLGEILAEVKNNNSLDARSERSQAEQAIILTQICNELKSLKAMSELAVSENSVLERLYFIDLYAREDSVADPSGHTFSWIVGQPTNSSFKSTSSRSTDGQDGISDTSEVSGAGEGREVELEDMEHDTNDTLKDDIEITHPIDMEKPLETGDGDFPESVTLLETPPINRPGSHEDSGETAGVTLGTAATESEVANVADDVAGQLSLKAASDSIHSTVTQDYDSASMKSHVPRTYISPGERSRREELSQELLKFLREDNGTFFISGKAGSGKSTLMSKFHLFITQLNLYQHWPTTHIHDRREMLH